MPDDSRCYLTVNETALRLRRSPDTIRRRIAAGDLRAVRLSADRGPLLVPVDALDELLRPARTKAAA